MCANCFTPGDFPYSGPVACWRAPMLPLRIAGIATPIPPLKKSPNASLGADLHRRSQLSAGLDAARDLESRGLSSTGSRHRGAQVRKDFWRDRVVARAVRLPPGDRLQCRDLSRLPRPTGPMLPPPRSHPDSRQCFVSQRPGGLGIVQIESALAGSASVATLFAGVKPDRAAMAAHPQERNPQPFL